MATVVPVSFCFPVRLAPAARSMSVAGSFTQSRKFSEHAVAVPSRTG